MNSPPIRSYTLFRFPATGRTLKQVSVDSEGSIKVKSGDTLIGYAIAIYNGNASRANEFGIYNGSQKKIVQLTPFTSLKPGSVVVCLPLCPQAKKDVPLIRPFPPGEYQKLLKNFAVEMSAPLSVQNVVSLAAKGVSAARLSALLTELSGTMVVGSTSTSLSAMSTQLGLRGGAAAVGGSCSAGTAFIFLQFAAPFLTILASVFTIMRSSGAGWFNTRMIGYAYGLTAFVFEKPLPAISNKLKTQVNKIRPHELPHHIKAWNEGATLAYRTDGPKFMARSKYSPDLFRLILRGAFQNQPHKYCEFVMDALLHKMDNKQKIAFRGSKENGFLYPR